MSTIKSILDAKSLKAFPTEDVDSPSMLRVNDVLLVPLSKDRTVAYPDWDEDYFSFPFACCVSPNQRTGHNNKQPSERRILSESVATVCLGACFFMLGQCYQSRSQDPKEPSPEGCLRLAMDFYSQAWHSVQPISQRTASQAGCTTSFLMMAIATNLSYCCYRNGALDAANTWLNALRDLVKISWLDENDHSLELHNFFLTLSTINTTFIAAGAA